MYLTSSRLITASLAVACIAILSCLIIQPQGWLANDGLSYYGGLPATLVPFVVALGSLAVCYWLAAGRLKVEQRVSRYVRPALRVMAVLLVALLIVPHTVLNPLHTAFGSALFALQLLIMLWLTAVTWWLPLVVLGTMVMLGSGLAALHYLPLHDGLLIQAQILFQTAFGLTLAYALEVLTRAAADYAQIED